MENNPNNQNESLKSSVNQWDTLKDVPFKGAKNESVSGVEQEKQKHNELHHPKADQLNALQEALWEAKNYGDVDAENGIRIAMKTIVQHNRLEVAPEKFDSLSQENQDRFYRIKIHEAKVLGDKEELVFWNANYKNYKIQKSENIPALPEKQKPEPNPVVEKDAPESPGVVKTIGIQDNTPVKDIYKAPEPEKIVEEYVTKTLNHYREPLKLIEENVNSEIKSKMAGLSYDLAAKDLMIKKGIKGGPASMRDIANYEGLMIALANPETSDTDKRAINEYLNAVDGAAMDKMREEYSTMKKNYEKFKALRKEYEKIYSQFHETHKELLKDNYEAKFAMCGLATDLALVDVGIPLKNETEERRLSLMKDYLEMMNVLDDPKISNADKRAINEYLNLLDGTAMNQMREEYNKVQSQLPQLLLRLREEEHDKYDKEVRGDRNKTEEQTKEQASESSKDEELKADVELLLENEKTNLERLKTIVGDSVKNLDKALREIEDLIHSKTIDPDELEAKVGILDREYYSQAQGLIMNFKRKNAEYEYYIQNNEKDLTKQQKINDQQYISNNNDYIESVARKVYKTEDKISKYRRYINRVNDIASANRRLLGF